MSYVQEVSNLGLDGDALRERPETPALHAAFVELTRDLPVLKVKIYGLNGRTIYSSEFSQIGETKPISGGFGWTLENRAPSSSISFRESFNAFSGTVHARHLTESYLPIFAAGDGKMRWIFALHGRHPAGRGNQCRHHQIRCLSHRGPRVALHRAFHDRSAGRRHFAEPISKPFP